MAASQESQDISPKPAPAADYVKIGLDLLGEVHKNLGDSRLKALRFSLGNRVLKDIPISRATMLVSIVIVVCAIVVTNLKIEIVKEPQDQPKGSTVVSGETL